MERTDIHIWIFITVQDVYIVYYKICESVVAERRFSLYRETSLNSYD